MVVHYAYPRDPRVSREARAAREAGYDVDVVCARDPGETRTEVVDGVFVIRLGVTKSNERGGLLSTLAEYVSFALRATLSLALRSVRKPRYDIVHVHAPPDFLVAAALVPKLLGSRVVLDVHDMSPLMFRERFAERRGAGLATRCLELVERAACRLADAVVTVHEPYVRELARQGVPPDKVTVVMNSPNDRLIESARAGSARRADSETFVIAYHGTITPWYGVPLVVQALAAAGDSLGDWHGLILGDGDALAEVRALADDLRVSDRLDLPGRFLPIEEALSLVAGADCGVIPNLPSALNRLTLSTKLLEYVALRVPVVVAGMPTFAEHFDDDEVTFFEPGDPGSLADALAWVAANPDGARAKADRALARFQAYSWTENRDRYLRLLDRLAGRPGRPLAVAGDSGEPQTELVAGDPSIR